MAGMTYRFNVGKFECMVIADGTGANDASRGTPVGVSLDEWLQALRDHNIPPDQVPYSLNILFVNTGTHRVLVDTGIGGDPTPGSGQLLETLQTEGIQPGDIDVVVITHGHWDHIGGLIGAGGELTFSNARHVMSKGEWDYWTSEATLAEMDESAANNIRRTLFPLRDRIDLIESDGEIALDVSAVPAPGHTPDQIAVLVSSGGQGLLNMADGAHNPIQAENPGWSHPFDKQPDVSAASRRRLVKKASSEHLLLMAYHFPFPGVGRISGSQGSWRWQPVT